MKSKQKKKQWTNKEIVRLCQLYPMTNKRTVLVTEFPGRTEIALRQKAAQLGLKRGSRSSSMILPPRPSMWKIAAEKHVPVIFGAGK